MVRLAGMRDCLDPYLISSAKNRSRVTSRRTGPQNLAESFGADHVTLCLRLCRVEDSLALSFKWLDSLV